MTLHEPATLLTDYFLGLLGSGLAYRLFRRISPGNKAAHWWIAALLVMSVAAFTGGTYHGFGLNFTPGVTAVWWQMVRILICATGLCMSISQLWEILPPERHRPWLGIIIAKSLLASVWILVDARFLVVLLDYGISMTAWLAAALVYRRPWSVWILTAVGLSALAGLVQQTQWGLSNHFNHNDVYHLIQATALVAFYRAGAWLGRATS